MAGLALIPYLLRGFSAVIWASAAQRLPDLDLPALPQLRDYARRRDDPDGLPFTSLRCLTTGTEAVYSMGLP